MLGRTAEGIQTLSGSGGGAAGLPALYLARTGRLLARHGRPMEAIAYLSEAVRLDPGSVRAELDLAACWIQTGKREEAESALRRILKRHPNQLEAAEGLAALEKTGGK